MNTCKDDLPTCNSRSLITTFLQKNKEDLSRISISHNMFQDVMLLKRSNVELSHPSAEDVLQFEALNTELARVDKLLSDPDNDDSLVQSLCMKAKSLQESKDKLEKLISCKKSQVRLTRNALSKAKEVVRYWKMQRQWDNVAEWQIMLNTASSLLLPLEQKQKTSLSSSASNPTLPQSTQMPQIDHESLTQHDTSLSQPATIQIVNGETVELDSAFILQLAHKAKRKIEARNGPTPTKKTKGCTEEEFTKYIKSKREYGNSSYENQSLVWLNTGIIFCQACQKTIYNLRSTRRHCKSEKHTTKIVKWKNENKYFKSGMVQSWNKFCFTGGIIEVDMIIPGHPFIGGLWPAVWMLGNLGRATYESSTNNIWPWSYDTCDRKKQQQQDKDKHQHR